MAEYQVRKLYNVSTASGSDSETYESMWAYYIRYPQTETNLPGRFRIRITKMTAAEFMNMMGYDEATAAPIGYSIQGYIEKWSDKGWQQCIDWIGSPESTTDEIEKDLLEMYKAFTTGQPANLSPSSYVPPSPPTKPPKKTKTAKNASVLKFPSGDSKKPNSGKNQKEDSDGFDWI